MSFYWKHSSLLPPKWIPASSVKATWSWSKHQIRHEEKCAKVNLIFISSQHLYRSQQHLLPVLCLWGNSFNVLPPSFPLLGFSSQNKSCNKIGCVWIISRSFFNWKPKWKKQSCLQFSDRAFPTTAWATTWPLAPSCPSEPCSTCCRTPGSSSHMFRQPCSPETFRQVRGTLKCSYWDVIVITTLLGRWHPRWWDRWRCHQLLEYDGM